MLAISSQLESVDMSMRKTTRSRSLTSAKENGPKLEKGLNPFKTEKSVTKLYGQSDCSLNDRFISFSSLPCPISCIFSDLFQAFSIAFVHSTSFFQNSVQIINLFASL